MTTITNPLAGRRVRPQGRSRFSVSRTLRYAVLLLFVVIVLIPVYVVLVTSFKNIGDATAANAWSLPQVWTLDNWKVAWERLAPSILRTAEMVVPAAIISSMLGSMNGFVLSRWRFPYANVVFTLILFGMFIPYQAVMVPLTQLLINTLHVPTGIPALILLHVIYGIPITTLIFRNYYESVPEELIEASKVDGAGMFRTYWSVVLPISIPSFVVVLIWQFTSAWNDYLFALFFSRPGTGPVTIELNMMTTAQLTNYGQAMSGAVLASLPTLLVYILLGKYFVGGLMSGSVKG